MVNPNNQSSRGGLFFHNGYIVVGLLLILVAVHAYLFSTQSQPIQASLLPKRIAQAKQTFHSYVPSYYLSATRQPLQVISLRRAELMAITAMNDEDAPNNTLVLLDKVIVLPIS